jgi:hypothetical protein
MRIQLITSGLIKKRKEVIRLAVRENPGSPAAYSVAVSRELKGYRIPAGSGDVSRDPDEFRKAVVALVKAATTLGSQ